MPPTSRLEYLLNPNGLILPVVGDRCSTRRLRFACISRIRIRMRARAAARHVERAHFYQAVHGVPNTLQAMKALFLRQPYETGIRGGGVVGTHARHERRHDQLDAQPRA
jgi:hypothetical protein